jgi:hypothetical protein
MFSTNVSKMFRKRFAVCVASLVLLATTEQNKPECFQQQHTNTANVVYNAKQQQSLVSGLALRLWAPTTCVGSRTNIT